MKRRKPKHRASLTQGQAQSIAEVFGPFVAALRGETFKVGDRVLKHTGDYQLLGEVRAVFTTTAGKVRYVVEHTPGFLHIYSAANLWKV